MKGYAIGYQEQDGKYRFFIYTCKFLSERKEIDEDFYEELKRVFTIAGNKNNSRGGIYFDCIQ
jgi:hypothetical protein